MREQEQKQREMAEEQMQHLRSRATELLLREEWSESIQVYCKFINLCLNQISLTHQNQDPYHLLKLKKSLCLALSNRAESRFRLLEFSDALSDCDQALGIENAHFKTLLCKGKILLSLNRYSSALDCFKTALLDPQANDNFETVNGFLEKCKKLEIQSRTGAFDLSDWIVNGFRGKSPELAEYIGAVQVKRSEISGRGLFATKGIEAGTLLVVTKAVATERGILPGQDSGENAQLVIWKNFIDKVTEATTKCRRIRGLINMLSTGENEDDLDVPDMSLFRPETEDCNYPSEKLEIGRILSILDVNSLVEDSVSAKVLGKNSDYFGVGLWVLASFINHSCTPNVRRLHVGDFVIIHASRDINPGEEITSAYFDVLSPFNKRKEMSKTWGFNCNCKRCKFEENLWSRQELREIDLGIERGIDIGHAIYSIEEHIRRWVVRGKEKGYMRASFWAAYSEAYSSLRVVKRWGRRIPAAEVVVESVAEGVGSDERIVKVLVVGMKRNGGGGVLEMERALKLGKGLYGKVVKKQALRTLLELGSSEHGY